VKKKQQLIPRSLCTLLALLKGFSQTIQTCFITEPLQKMQQRNLVHWDWQEFVAFIILCDWLQWRGFDVSTETHFENTCAPHLINEWTGGKYFTVIYQFQRWWFRVLLSADKCTFSLKVSLYIADILYFVLNGNLL